MIESTIEELWSDYRFNNCDDCNKEDCKGRLDYDNLCSNLNYLKEYGRKNYEKNAETFIELKRIMQLEKPTIFSFGAGIALLKMVKKNAVICFFNSLFTISENSDLKEKLVSALSDKTNFYFVCNLR